MTRVTQQTFHIQKLIFLSLSALCFALVGLYMYFLCVSVSQVVMRTDINQQTVQISSDISQLESTYIAEQHKVSAEIASLQGYQRTDAKIFIDRSESSLALSSRNIR